MTTVPFLYLAPIRGLTDHTFRNCYAKHFQGIDGCVAPFINPQRHSSFKEKHLRDVLPENNRRLKIIPQLLHTTEDDFLVLSHRLAGLGYTQINWNLGCPMPMVAKKKRGSGLLPYPEKILSFLDTVIPKLPTKLSIKTRLGFFEVAETERLLPQLNGYPLEEIIVHARLGKQRYKGKTDLESFEKILNLSTHKIVYNGDITTVKIFDQLQGRFPSINRWMIGRGVIGDPLLPMKIKNGQNSTVDVNQQLFDFHNDLYNHYEAKLSGPSHLLGRMKQIWQYLIFSFPGNEKNFKRLMKAGKSVHYLEAVNRIFSK